MAKTTAPLLSFDAAGAIAKTQVYSRWRGVPYVRRYVIPANPRTTAQTLTRDIFRTMGQVWNFLPASARTPWETFSTGRAFTGRNAFTGQNLRAIRAAPTDFTDFIGSPGARGGLPPAGVSNTSDGSSVTSTITAPDAPTGWTLTAAQGILFPDGDPAAEFSDAIAFQEDTSSAYELAFSGLTASTDYVVSVWLEWEKPDGVAAFSISDTEIVSTTA